MLLENIYYKQLWKIAYILIVRDGNFRCHCLSHFRCLALSFSLFSLTTIVNPTFYSHLKNRCDALHSNWEKESDNSVLSQYPAWTDVSQSDQSMERVIERERVTDEKGKGIVGSNKHVFLGKLEKHLKILPYRLQ